MTTKVKICGITRAEDAEVAVSNGAWAIGMILYEASSRYCEPARAIEIAEQFRRRAEVVGVFVNASLEQVVSAADTIPLTMVQLHGDEGPAYCAEVARSTGLQVIKVARVKDAASVRELAAFKTDFHMLDTHVGHAYGGSGESFDWELAAEHPHTPPMILSGGLTPSNVTDAIDTVKPFAVDVASGVERSPGIKDLAKVKSFIASAQSARTATA